MHRVSCYMHLHWASGDGINELYSINLNPCFCGFRNCKYFYEKNYSCFIHFSCSPFNESTIIVAKTSTTAHILKATIGALLGITSYI